MGIAFAHSRPKERRVDDSERSLELLQRNKKENFKRYVTRNETWIHHDTPESNRQSADSLSAPGGVRQERPLVRQ